MVFVLAAGVCLSVCDVSGVAAHGRPPSLGQIVFDPSDPARIVGQATWGAVLSEDAGRTWRWICASSLGVDARFQDPRMLLTDEGRLLAGTFDGLVRGDPTLCSFDRPSEALADAYVIDVVPVPGRPGSALAVRTSGLEPDRLFASTDSGATWEPLGDPIEELLIERLYVAASQTSRLYAGGGIPGDPRRAFVAVSDDGGTTLDRREVPLEPGEWNVFVHAVDPGDADRLFAQVAHFNGEEVDERLVRSEDAARSWETVHRLPQIGGIAFSADGATIWTGSRLGGLYRSTDGGGSWELVDPTIAVRCLAARDGELWVCTDPSDTRIALMRSSDAGASFEPVLRLPDVHALAECPRCSPVGIECPAWFPDLAYDLRLDAAIPDAAVFADASTGAPRDAGFPTECLGPVDAGFDAGRTPSGELGGGGCDCSVSRHASAVWPAAPIVGALFIFRRRRRAGHRAASSRAVRASRSRA